MNTSNRKPARALLALLPGLVLAQAAWASGKYLDVIGEIQLSSSGTSHVGKKIVVQEDWIVGIQCTDRIRIVDPKTYWLAAKDEHWETLVQVDGKTIEIREGHIPQGKQMGAKYSGGVFSSKATHFDKEIAWPHAMVFWKPAGTGPGTKEIRCVANHGGTLSDNTTANNTAVALVEVVAAKAKPPSSEPPPNTTPPPLTPATGLQTTAPARPGGQGTAPPAGRRPDTERRPGRPSETPPARPQPEPGNPDSALRAVGCHRPDADVPAYVCSSQEGLARCQRLLQQGEVRSCELRGARR